MQPSPPSPSESSASPAEHAAPTSERTGWFDDPRYVNLLIVALGIVCLGLAAADFFYENPHPHFAIESMFAFQAWFGFLAFVVIVFLGRLLRAIVMRPEDYYDR